MKIENPLISIAIATYNGEKYITEQLNSIVGQSYRNLEIVIVDDRSTDGTYQILKDFRKLDSRIRIYENIENLGFNANFNGVLALTTGDYIAISDQDDIWDKEKISYMLKTIESNVLLYHNSVFIDEKGDLKGKKMSDLHRFVKGNCEAFLLYHNCVSGHACFFHRDLLKICLPFPEEIYYDWWMAYTAACLGKINYIEKAFVLHRRHSQSSTENDKANNAKSQRIKNLTLFKDHQLTSQSTKTLIVRLLEGYNDLTRNKFSFKLFFLLMGNAKKVFYVRKKSLFSMLRFLFNESFRSG